MDILSSHGGIHFVTYYAYAMMDDENLFALDYRIRNHQLWSHRAH